jgi:hypothetical protein
VDFAGESGVEVGAEATGVDFGAQVAIGRR